MIGLVTDHGSIRFDINLAAIAAAGLRVERDAGAVETIGALPADEHRRRVAALAALCAALAGCVVVSASVSNADSTASCYFKLTGLQDNA